MKKWGLSVLVVLSLLAMTFGTAFASPVTDGAPVDPGAIVTTNDGYTFNWEVNGGAQAYAWIAAGCDWRMEDWISIDPAEAEGSIDLVKQATAFTIVYTFFPYEEGDPIWSASYQGQCPQPEGEASVTIAPDGASAHFEATGDVRAMAVYSEDCNPKVEPSFFEFWKHPRQSFNLYIEPDKGEIGLKSVEVVLNTLDADGYYNIVYAERSCATKPAAPPYPATSPMYLGIKAGTPPCMLFSLDGPPSEKSWNKCFSDPAWQEIFKDDAAMLAKLKDWVPDKVPCVDAVLSDDTWSCDKLLHANHGVRRPLNNPDDPKHSLSYIDSHYRAVYEEYAKSLLK